MPAVDTHEEALAYLGANKDTSDEMITALYATKVSIQAFFLSTVCFPCLSVIGCRSFVSGCVLKESWRLP